MGKREQRWNDPDAHRVLRKLYEERIVPTGMTQKEFGARYDIGNQSMVWQYLSGKVPLSLEAAGRFAHALGCKIHDFSPMLADQLKSDILPVLGSKSWWKGLLIALLVVLALPSTQPAHASFSSRVASSVYYVKSWLRSLLTVFNTKIKHFA